MSNNGKIEEELIDKTASLLALYMVLKSPEEMVKFFCKTYERRAGELLVADQASLTDTFEQFGQWLLGFMDMQ